LKFINNEPAHNKSLHWIFSPLRFVKTGVLRRYKAIHDSCLDLIKKQAPKYLRLPKVNFNDINRM